jgi:hypothetical protein
MPGSSRPLLLALLLASPGDPTLITVNGERLVGKAARVGDAWVVETPAGPRRIPASEVGVVYTDVADPVREADARFKEAKRLFEEAQRLNEADPVRNQKLLTAIELAQAASQTYRLLEPHHRGESFAFLGKNLQVMMQFIRLCRGAATSDLAGPAEAPRAGPIPLLEAKFELPPLPPEPKQPWIYEKALGPGQEDAARDLEHPDPARRLAALRRLLHPPAPERLPDFLRLLEREKSPEMVKALAEGLPLLDAAGSLKTLGWVRREADPAKREIVLAIARAANDRGGFDFLLDWFAEAPPATHADRAAFAGAFRQYHASAAPELKELLTKQKAPKLQIEILRQMGALGDKALAPMLVKAIDAYPRDAAAAILKIGKPALPTVIEGARSNDPDTKRICIALCRKLTGVQQINLDHFEKWYLANRKAVQEEEAARAAQAAKAGYAVNPLEFVAYDLPLEALLF